MTLKPPELFVYPIKNALILLSLKLPPKAMIILKILEVNYLFYSKIKKVEESIQLDIRYR